MKKTISAFLLILVFVSLLTPSALAKDSVDAVIPNEDTTIEYLDDGSYFVIEVTQSPTLGRSTNIDGYKEATYYSKDGTAIWTIQLHGYFTYTSGVSAKATSASVSVILHDSGASFISKDSYISGATAYGSTKVKYGSVTVSKAVDLTCSVYGVLS